MNYEWTVADRESGQMQARGECPELPDAMREALRYGLLYEQDGPIRVKVWRGGKVELMASGASACRMLCAFVALQQT